MSKLFGKKNQMTMRPVKKVQKGTLQYDLHKLIKEGRTKGKLSDIVKCPPNQNLEEWLAVNCFDFFNSTIILYSALSNLCRQTDCPIMNAGGKMEYHWMENKKTIQLPAREYCERLFDWVQSNFDDTKVFPSEFSGKPPKAFMPTLKKIFQRLFRVYAHMFHSHSKHLDELELTEQAMIGFKHFYLFCREFNLLTPNDVMPLQDMCAEIDKEFTLPELK